MNVLDVVRTFSRGLRSVARQAAIVLLVCAPLAAAAQQAGKDDAPAAATPRPVVPSEPGSPLAITNAAGYTERVTRGGVTLSTTPRLCVSFQNVSDKPLKAVTIELVHLRLDGSVSELQLLKRFGTFSPGVEIRGYQGEKVGMVDGHAAANCPEFSMMIPGVSDGVRTVIRPIAAVFEDGTTWASARPPSAIVTPAPVADEAVPPWDTAHHAGYLAIESGGGTWQHPAPQVVEIYAPGHRKPSASISFPKCCVEKLVFDDDGDLLVATTGMHEGLLLYAPGSTEPTKKFPDVDGRSLAAGSAGELAIGDVRGSTDVTVYPRDGAAYRIQGQQSASSFAFAPNGELAVADYKSHKVRIYPRGAVTAAREFAPDPTKPASGPGALMYDRAGNLAVMADNGIVVFEPGADHAAYGVRTVGPATMAFDGTGRLVVCDASGITIYAEHSTKPLKRLPREGIRLAADRTGRFAVASFYRSNVAVVETDGTMTEIPIPTRPSEIAFSP